MAHGSQQTDWMTGKWVVGGWKDWRIYSPTTTSVAFCILRLLFPSPYFLVWQPIPSPISNPFSAQSITNPLKNISLHPLSNPFLSFASFQLSILIVQMILL
jgi:hypothetical protein